MSDLSRAFHEAVVGRHYHPFGVLPCWFALHGIGGAKSSECCGRIEGAHLLKRRRVQRVLKERGLEPELIQQAAWDPRNGVPACHEHHSRYDGHGRGLGVTEWTQLPPSFHDFAIQYDLEAEVESDFNKRSESVAQG